LTEYKATAGIPNIFQPNTFRLSVHAHRSGRLLTLTGEHPSKKKKENKEEILEMCSFRTIMASELTQRSTRNMHLKNTG